MAGRRIKAREPWFNIPEVRKRKREEGSEASERDIGKRNGRKETAEGVKAQRGLVDDACNGDRDGRERGERAKR